MNLLWSFVLCSIWAFAASQNCDNVEVSSVELSEEDGNLIVTWATNGLDAGDCEFTVTYSSNSASLPTATYTATGTSLVIEKVVPCSTVHVAVIRVGGIESITASRTLDTRVSEAPVLIDMITSCNSIQMLWDAQSFDENMCEVTHFQMFCLSDTHNFTIPQLVADDHDRSFDILITVLQPDIYYTCNGFIFVTLAGFSPPSDNIEFWSNLDSVRDLNLEENGDRIRASWEAPLNSEECGVAYDVTYENEVLGTSTVEVVGLSHDFDIAVLPCTSYTITVTPISFTGSKGTGVSRDITPDIRFNTPLELAVNDNSDLITLSWNQIEIGKCGVIYTVTRYVNDEIADIMRTTGTSVVFERITCATYSFEVSVEAEGIAGQVAYKTITLDESDITSISAVRNVRLEGNLVAWDSPETVGLCSISYIVAVSNAFENHVQITDETSVDLNLIPCSNNLIEITGVSGDISGVATIHAITAPTGEFSAPVHIRTVPSLTSASVTLQADDLSENSCRVEAAVVECSNDDGDSFDSALGVIDDASRQFTVDLEDLQQDTIYTCVAKWQDSSATTEFKFRTVPIEAKQLFVSDITQDGFLVSWTEDYGEQFVNGYTLIVESRGPAHDVPESCDIERSATYTFEVAAGELNKAFVEGFPDYVYNIRLVTSYNLGIESTSESLSANTLTGVPAVPENLYAEFFVNDGYYDVTGVLGWKSPCTLNGALRNFGVRIVATFSVAGNEQSVEIAETVSANDDPENSYYRYELVDVNPLFRYKVLINTVAASTSESVELVLHPPSACVCYLSEEYYK